MIVVRPLGTISAGSMLQPGALSQLQSRSAIPTNTITQTAATKSGTTALAASVAASNANRPTCEAGCSADPGVMADTKGDTLRRCVGICTGTGGDIDTGIRNSQRGNFCAILYNVIAPALGSVSNADVGLLFNTCSEDPEAFLDQAAALGIDPAIIEQARAALDASGIVAKPFWKKPGVLILGGAAVLLGLVALKRRK